MKPITKLITEGSQDLHYMRNFVYSKITSVQTVEEHEWNEEDR